MLQVTSSYDDLEKIIMANNKITRNKKKGRRRRIDCAVKDKDGNKYFDFSLLNDPLPDEANADEVMGVVFGGD